jgi:hypothetical protein
MVYEVAAMCRLISTEEKINQGKLIHGWIVHKEIRICRTKTETVFSYTRSQMIFDFN